MKMQEQIKLFCEMFDCDRDYAKQCFADIGEFIETAMTMGESVKFPGIVELTIDYVSPRNIYNFKTGAVQPSKGRFKPSVRYGKKIIDTVASASVINRKKKQAKDDVDGAGD